MLRIWGFDDAANLISAFYVLRSRFDCSYPRQKGALYLLCYYFKYFFSKNESTFYKIIFKHGRYSSDVLRIH